MPMGTGRVFAGAQAFGIADLLGMLDIAAHGHGQPHISRTLPPTGWAGPTVRREHEKNRLRSAISTNCGTICPGVRNEVCTSSPGGKRPPYSAR